MSKSRVFHSKGTHNQCLTLAPFAYTDEIPETRPKRSAFCLEGGLFASIARYFERQTKPGESDNHLLGLINRPSGLCSVSALPVSVGDHF